LLDGIGVAREGVPWPLVDKGDGGFDFSCIDPFLDAQRRHNILPIWDLCHYGYPDHLEFDSEGFAASFARFSAEAVRLPLSDHRALVVPCGPA